MGNIRKATTSNGKQLNVSRGMLNAVARDQSWPDVAAGIVGRFQKLLLFVLLYNKSLDDWSLRIQ